MRLQDQQYIRVYAYSHFTQVVEAKVHHQCQHVQNDTLNPGRQKAHRVLHKSIGCELLSIICFWRIMMGSSRCTASLYLSRLSLVAASNVPY